MLEITLHFSYNILLSLKDKNNKRQKGKVHIVSIKLNLFYYSIFYTGDSLFIFASKRLTII